MMRDADRQKISAFVRLFQSGDFDAIRAMLADDVKLELVNRLELEGRDKIAPYFARYAEARKWRFSLGAIEGRPAMLVFDGDATELAVGNVRIALPDLDEVAVRIADVAPRFAVLFLRLRDEFGSPRSPCLVAGVNVCNPDIHEAADAVRVGGDRESHRWFVGCRTTADVDDEPRVRDPHVPRCAAGVASA